MPTISVIIPACNSEKTIQETINSVLNQTYSDFELIIVNDRSSDRTLDVINSITDSRIRVFSQTNAGVSAARNKGISYAQGEFVTFLDADDLWTSDKLEAQLEALKQHPEAAVAYSWTDYIDEKSQFLHSGDRPTASGNVYQKILVKNFIDSGSNPLIRRDALLNTGQFNESFNYGEDWDLWVRLAARYSFVVVRRPQILYRVSQQSVSNNLPVVEKRTVQVIDQVFSQVKPVLHPLKQQSLGNFYLYLVLRSMENINPQNRFLVLRWFWKTISFNPALLKDRTKLMLILFVKVMAIAVGIPKL